MIKLSNIEPAKLIHLIEKAKEDVYLITEDGDTLNMKSKLSQLLGIKMLLETIHNDSISANLNCKSAEDEKMFIEQLSPEN